MTFFVCFFPLEILNIAVPFLLWIVAICLLYNFQLIASNILVVVRYVENLNYHFSPSKNTIVMSILKFVKGRGGNATSTS